MVSRRSVRVLVVEDHHDLRDVLLDLLQEAGHVCVGAHDVESARAHLESAFDVVLLDLHLQGELAETLLADLCRESVIVVLTSADTTERARTIARRWSVPLVTKPFDVDYLLGVIEGAVAGAS